MFVSLCPLIYKSSSFLTRHLCCALQSTSKRLLPLPTTQNSHQTHGALRAVRDAPSVERRWPALPARTLTEPQAASHAQSSGLTHCHHLVHLVCCLDHMVWHTRLLAARRLHSTACAAQPSLLRTKGSTTSTSTVPTSLTRL